MTNAPVASIHKQPKITTEKNNKIDKIKNCCDDKLPKLTLLKYKVMSCLILPKWQSLHKRNDMLLTIIAVTARVMS